MKALVTGAGVRVGQAIALALARDGFDVIVHANQSDVTDTVAQVEAMGRKAYVERADLSLDEDVDALAQRIVKAHPKLDVVVHSAGIFEELAFADITRERFRRMQRINAEAPFFLTQGLLPALDGALVVHIVDVTAHRPIQKFAHYTMAKAALYGLTKALCVELGPRVRVCGIAPGIVASFPKELDDQGAKIISRIPLKRTGEPDDVARAVVFLARSPYMNGVVLPVDGGWMVTP